jgi:hypothetical protein
MRRSRDSQKPRHLIGGRGSGVTAGSPVKRGLLPTARSPPSGLRSAWVSPSIVHDSRLLPVITSPRPTLPAVPISDAENKQWALDRICDLAPQTVVDIGPGAGTYSDLARAHTRGAMWKAVEAWAPYIAEHGLWQKYDHVIVADVRHVDLHSIAYAPDLVIIGDVLEHLEKAEARSVLRLLQAWADNVLVSIPLAHHPQEAVGGNWFEIHRDHWGHEEMLEALGAGVVDSVVGDVLGYYLWRVAA